MTIPAAILAIEYEGDRSFMIQLYVDYRWLVYGAACEIIQDAQIAEDRVSQAACERIDALDDVRKIDSKTPGS